MHQLNRGSCSLGKRLPRMPFPPGTKEASFDYEAVLNENVRNAPLYIAQLLFSPYHGCECDAQTYCVCRAC